MEIRFEKLRAARIRHGLSQRGLAMELRISNQAIGLIERGKSKSPKTLKAIADYLGVSMDDVVVEHDRASQ